MEINEDPNAPVTRFTSMNVVPEQTNIMAGDFFGFPQLSQAEIDEIPVENLLPGIVVYNTDFNVYMAYFINEEDDSQNRWMNVNTSLTYKSTGLEVGSPFALPAGVSTVIENPDSGNSDPGVMYIATDLNDQPRIFINGAWQDVATSGDSSTTFEDITVTNEAQIANLVVTTSSNFIGTFEAATIGANIINVTNLVDFNLTSTGTADLNFVNVERAATFASTAIIQDLQVGTSSGAGGICGYYGVANSPTGSLGTAGAGSGGGSSMAITGTELSGTIAVNTGTGLSGTVIFTFTIHNPIWQTYSSPFGVIFTPATALTYTDSFAAKATGVVTQLATNSLNAIITYSSGGATQLQDSTSYKWNYMIIGNSAVDI